MDLTSPAHPSFRAPPLSLLAVEPLRALFDSLSAGVVHAAAPIGDGHPVVVYPGLGGGSLATSQLRRFLKDCGFTVHDWEGGINTGHVGVFDDWLGSLEPRVRDLHALHGRTVSLIGWSLGGIYAREIAKRCPGAVRQVITLATPFNSLGHGNHAGTLFQLLSQESARLAPDVEARLRECPPVPTTSIYSKSDGIVAWRGCIEKKSERSESVQVSASHLGMVSHPQVLRIVANRLAQPEGRWRPLRRGERLGG
jgi:alpha-beta hydrolase superfamily lysophospholipase